MKSLTPKQQTFYDSLVEFFQEHLRMPSHSEAAEINDLKSKNSSLQYHQTLVEKGHLTNDGQGNYSFANPIDGWAGNHQSNFSIPVLGEITAGPMQEAIESDLGSITFRDLFPKAEKVFALRVKGMSMKGLNITDGDYVLLSKTELRNGDVGAVLYNGETTLKKVQKEGKQLRLKPANTDYDDIVIEPGESEEVRILGKYVGHMNKEGIFKSSFLN